MTVNPENQIALLTAAMIVDDCPVKLRDAARFITTHLEKAERASERAENHRISAAQYLLQVREACDEGGFHAFREKFCPSLGRTRAYELLSIASGRKTITEVRAATAERMQKHRAEKKLESVTVTDSRPAQAEPQTPVREAVAYDPAADELTIEEMQADPAAYWQDLTHEVWMRLHEAHRAARLACIDRDHVASAKALGDLIATASELQKFYAAHLLPPGREAA